MSFDYTSGNPSNLVGGTAASMADIQGPFTDLKTFLNQRIAAIPTLVSSLPVSPTDGQEIHYLADATNGVVWHLRYRLASGSAFKWEFVGGSSLHAEVDTAESGGPGGYGSLATAGPSVTVPLQGEYIIDHGANAFFSFAGTAAALMSYDVGATAASDTWAAQLSLVSGSTTVHASIMRQRRWTGIAAASAVVSRYRSVTNAVTWRDRWLSVRPVRVG